MFTKVLISEDLGSISKGIVSVLESLHIDNIQHVQYCDDAYLKIKKANQDEQPFDLLITDFPLKLTIVHKNMLQEKHLSKP